MSNQLQQLLIDFYQHGYNDCKKCNSELSVKDAFNTSKIKPIIKEEFGDYVMLPFSVLQQMQLGLANNRPMDLTMDLTIHGNEIKN